MVSDDCLDEVKTLQSQRRFCIRLQIRNNNTIEAHIARQIGYHLGLSQQQRKTFFAKAKKLRQVIEKTPGWHDPAYPQLSAVASTIRAAGQTRALWDNRRQEFETHMRKLGKSLPGYNFVSQQKGLTSLGLAVLAAEAGDLDNYPTAGKLWKRMGLAVINGKAQRNLNGDASEEERKRSAYNPRRRAESWVFFSDNIIRAQVRREKTEKDGTVVSAHTRGQYGEIYLRQKEEYLERGWTLLHAERAARRYMEKRLLFDVWKAWRRDTGDQVIVVTQCDRVTDLAAD